MSLDVYAWRSSSIPILRLMKPFPVLYTQRAEPDGQTKHSVRVVLHERGTVCRLGWLFVFDETLQQANVVACRVQTSAREARVSYAFYNFRLAVDSRKSVHRFRAAGLSCQLSLGILASEYSRVKERGLRGSEGLGLDRAS